MNINNRYSNAAEAQSKTTAAIVGWVREFFPYIILVLNVIITIVSRLFSAELQNPFTAEFFISLGNNLISTSFCYICFISYGDKCTKAAMPSFSHNLKSWSELSAVVRAKSDHFVEYCRAESEKERDERRIAFIVNNTLISIERYEKEYKGLKNRGLRKLVREGKISRSEAHFIRKANGVKIKPINPLLILCGVKIAHLNEAGREGMKYSTLSVIIRPLIVFGSNALISMISGRWLGLSDPSVIFDMILLSLLIIVSSVLGYSAGAENAKREHDKIKARIFFIEKYQQSGNKNNLTERAA